jgi:uncharacterized membrane protein YfcA
MHWIQEGIWILIGGVVGVLAGFLGVGGGLVVTPLLLYLGYSPPAATATSLAFVIPTAWASVMKSREQVDVTLTVLLASGAAVGAYAIGQPLVQSPRLSPRLYKTLFGLLLLVIGLDLVTGWTDGLRARQVSVQSSSWGACCSWRFGTRDPESQVPHPLRGAPLPEISAASVAWSARDPHPIAGPRPPAPHPIPQGQ